MIIEFNDDNFEQEVLEASKKKPVLVDFFASWCRPCKIQSSIVNEVAKVMGDKAIVGGLDTENSQKIASKFGVMSIPNIILFKNGKIIENMVGLQTKESLINIIEKYL